MICKDYAAFRYRFGTPGTVAFDGHRAWPSSKVSAAASFLRSTSAGLRYYIGAFAAAPSGMTVYLSQGIDDSASFSLRATESTTLPLALPCGVSLALTVPVGTNRLAESPEEEARILGYNTHVYIMNNATGDIVFADLFKLLGGTE